MVLFNPNRTSTPTHPPTPVPKPKTIDGTMNISVQHMGAKPQRTHGTARTHEHARPRHTQAHAHTKRARTHTHTCPRARPTHPPPMQPQLPGIWIDPHHHQTGVGTIQEGRERAGATRRKEVTTTRGMWRTPPPHKGRWGPTHQATLRYYEASLKRVLRFAG